MIHGINERNGIAVSYTVSLSPYNVFLLGLHIAEAVLQYMGKKSGEDTGVSQESIQAMVRLLVRQEMGRIAGEVPVSDIGTLTSQQLQPETEKKPAETVIEDLNEEGPPIDERTMQDIADAMAAFRNM